MAGNEDSSARPREILGIWVVRHPFAHFTKMSNKGILRKLHRMASNEQKLEPERNRAGNPEGLSLFDDIESMKQDLKDLKGSLQEESKARQKESKKHDQDIRELSKRTRELELKWDRIRASELEWLNHDYDRVARRERNEMIHGADILADLKALSYLETVNLHRFKSACMGFKKRYDLLWEDKTRIEQFPCGIIDVVNIRGNLAILERWEAADAKKEATPIISSCDAIVKKWANSQEEGYIYTHHSMEADCNDVKERYENACMKFP